MTIRVHHRCAIYTRKSSEDGLAHACKAGLLQSGEASLTETSRSEGISRSYLTALRDWHSWHLTLCVLSSRVVSLHRLRQHV